MADRTVTTFGWDNTRQEWRLATRRDGRPLVEAWPGVYVMLDRGRPRLVVPQAED